MLANELHFLGRSCQCFAWPFPFYIAARIPLGFCFCCCHLPLRFQAPDIRSLPPLTMDYYLVPQSRTPKFWVLAMETLLFQLLLQNFWLLNRLNASDWEIKLYKMLRSHPCMFCELAARRLFYLCQIYFLPSLEIHRRLTFLWSGEFAFESGLSPHYEVSSVSIWKMIPAWPSYQADSSGIWDSFPKQ